ncbi:MAG: hypothetical protein Kow0022_04760 [Phycisphaerales bacterium]
MISRDLTTMLTALAMAHVAAAQNAASDALVRELLAKLDSPVLAEREQAGQTLSNLPHFSLEDLETLVAQSELSPEQRLRLRQVGRRLFDSRPLAGMGVQFGGSGAEGVIIQDTIPGFHAAELLKPLDTIRSVNGQRMTTQEDLRWLILSHDPGDVLEVEILRDGRLETLSVRLGVFDDLPNAQRPSPVDLARAFALRWEHLPAPPGRTATIAAGLTIERWASVEAENADAQPDQAWPLTRESGARMISFGGQARTFLNVHQAFAQQVWMPDEFVGSREFGTTIAQVIDRIRTLSRQRAVIDQRARTLEQHAATTANPDQRAQFQAMREQALQELIQVDAELALMREALRQLREGGR